ncbi:rhomboid family intramembrane serine protease [Fluviicola taffensis]|uniref:Rhomboid family protein n=1 Tax=Fluviicola taffensis (strain DSM 16823 / NCIMB 13979 / RW262) TaxID=755732 RepID=F2I9Q4_FLUTR|nr:rhomboid family intramembrane serine protease [Fluviicola taffensis]AEA43050.1 Rhomboid family protein [Fluviicola taffensis DSM 16823]
MRTQTKIRRSIASDGSAAEALIYPLLLLLLCWVIWLLETTSGGSSLIEWGIRPRQWSSWKGLFFMPLLHDPSSVKHILNNSLPTYLLLAAVIYYYREIALKVFLISWFGTGFIVWWVAQDNGAYHIGMSGVIYALFGFLFISGFFRRVKALQGISLAIIFLYGSMIWGIFPMEPSISWEGHFGGFTVGVLLAIFYRKKGPVSPKFQYEIEREMGIEPPDLEGIWKRNQEEMEQRILFEQMIREQQELNPGVPFQVIYHINPTTKLEEEEKPQGDTEK